MLAEFRRRFWLPPRAHGDIIEDRTVSFLELFYDLVYVVVIARAAHHLAEHVSWSGVGQFVVIFGLIWIAWLNGTLFYELHGREDGRTRVFVFIQMLLLALLAVFTGDAGGDDGRQFALVYAVYLGVLSWLWYSVRRQDSEEYMTVTARYLMMMIVSILVMVGSALLSEDARMIAWAALVAGWVVGWLAYTAISGEEFETTVTDSMVERYGLFVIIVLGEVVVGVVEGLSEAERSLRSVATGMVGLGIGFGYWWTYFDYIGRRHPVASSVARTRWMLSHLPVTMSIAAAGAAMVSLVEHAEDSAAPADAAWLLGGSVAFGLVALVATMATLQDFYRLPTLYRPVAAGLVVAAGVALLVAWLAPAPWLLALLLVFTLGLVWLFAVDRWLRLDDPDQIRPGAG